MTHQCFASSIVYVAAMLNKIAFQSKTDSPPTRQWCDVFAPVTLTLTLTRWPWHDLYIPKTYPYTKSERSRPVLSNVRAYRQTDRQTNRQTDKQVRPQRPNTLACSITGSRLWVIRLLLNCWTRNNLFGTKTRKSFTDTHVRHHRDEQHWETQSPVDRFAWVKSWNKTELMMDMGAIRAARHSGFKELPRYYNWRYYASWVWEMTGISTICNNNKHKLFILKIMWSLERLSLNVILCRTLLKNTNLTNVLCCGIPQHHYYFDEK